MNCVIVHSTETLLSRLFLQNSRFFFDSRFQSNAGKRSNEYGTEDGRAKSAKTELSMSDIENALRTNQEKLVTVQNLKDFIASKKAHAPSKAVKKNLFEYAKQLIQ